MNKKKCKKLYQEIQPLIEKIIELTAEYGVSERISFWTLDKGYFHFDLGKNVPYDMVRMSESEPVLLLDSTGSGKYEPLFEEVNTCQETDPEEP